MDIETVLSLILGIALASAVGFRIFVPFFILSLATHYQVIDLNENWLWIGSTTAMITFGIATIVEILAYLIPWIDNILDTIAVPIAAVAGTAIMLSTVANFDPLITWTLAIIAGGGTATAIKTSTSGTRLASSVATAGFANPVISIFESGFSIILAVLAIFLPVLAIVLVGFIFWMILKLYKTAFSKKRS